MKRYHQLRLTGEKLVRNRLQGLEGKVLLVVLLSDAPQIIDKSLCSNAETVDTLYYLGDGKLFPGNPVSQSNNSGKQTYDAIVLGEAVTWCDELPDILHGLLNWLKQEGRVYLVALVQGEGGNGTVLAKLSAILHALWLLGDVEQCEFFGNQWDISLAAKADKWGKQLLSLDPKGMRRYSSFLCGVLGLTGLYLVNRLFNVFLPEINANGGMFLKFKIKF